MSTKANNNGSSLLAKYSREARYDAPRRRSDSPTYPTWWDFDHLATWVMVDGCKTEVNPDDLGDYLLADGFLAGKDENGYYLKGWGRNPKVYINPRECTQGWGDAGWWKYSKTIKKSPRN